MNTYFRENALISKLLLGLQMKSLFDKPKKKSCFEVQYKKLHLDNIHQDEFIKYYYAPKWL